jgi:hypothetical protein
MTTKYNNILASYSDLASNDHSKCHNNSNPARRDQVIDKLSKIRTRRYIGPNHVTSLITYFWVPKGPDDIRLVYDGSASGLNSSIWVPRFPLPTINTHLRAIEAGTYMSDLDIGDMFLNFVLYDELQELAGVHLAPNFPSDTSVSDLLWGGWHRCAMGIRLSPYQCVQGIALTEEIILGDHTDPTNVFSWDTVRLNLPGSDDYDPSLPFHVFQK